MALDELTAEQTVAMFLHVADGILRSAETLNDADRAVGDGDHGEGMARGFSAAREKLTAETFTSVDMALRAVGMAMMSTMGGASGAVFGTLFRAGGQALAGETALTSQGLAQMLAAGLEAVQKRGGAQVGDKTMIDALEPAARQAQQVAGEPLSAAALAVAEAARLGMENSRGLIAAQGRARTLGERALGHPDPGAMSMHLILHFMAEYIARLAGQSPTADGLEPEPSEQE